MKTKKEKTLEAHGKLITKYKKALIKLDRLRSTKILNVGADIRITNYKSIILFVKKGFKVYNVKNDYYSDITNAIMKGESKPIKLQEKAIHQPSIISKLREKRLKVILEKKII